MKPNSTVVHTLFCFVVPLRSSIFLGLRNRSMFVYYRAGRLLAIIVFICETQRRQNKISVCWCCLSLLSKLLIRTMIWIWIVDNSSLYCCCVFTHNRQTKSLQWMIRTASTWHAHKLLAPYYTQLLSFQLKALFLYYMESACKAAHDRHRPPLCCDCGRIYKQKSNRDLTTIYRIKDPCGSF